MVFYHLSDMLNSRAFNWHINIEALEITQASFTASKPWLSDDISLNSHPSLTRAEERYVERLRLWTQSVDRREGRPWCQLPSCPNCSVPGERAIDGSGKSRYHGRPCEGQSTQELMEPKGQKLTLTEVPRTFLVSQTAPMQPLLDETLSEFEEASLW